MISIPTALALNKIQHIRAYASLASLTPAIRSARYNGRIASRERGLRKALRNPCYGLFKVA
ncbi:MAG: hypothetical protein HFACDABA_02245 [Anaerolineales bacterium]|nr:hypothetical protein [Anaerolineales bacterium]